MNSSTTDTYLPAQPHGGIEPLGHDVWWVPGTMRMNPLMKISRNMVIVKSGAELTLLNPIRLDGAGEAALEALGRVRHLVRLGCFHGCDDAYLKRRFGADFWCQADSSGYPEPSLDHVLAEGGALPFPDPQLIVFHAVRRPECALLIRRGSGILVTCDSLQYYASWERHSLTARLLMPRMGFSRSLLIGPLWLKFQTPEGGSLKPDFDRLLALEFDAFVSAHGAPLMRGAKAAAKAAIERVYAA
jgi:hypothetical protein